MTIRRIDPLRYVTDRRAQRLANAVLGRAGIELADVFGMTLSKGKWYINQYCFDAGRRTWITRKGHVAKKVTVIEL